MTAVDQSETRVVSSGTNERQGMTPVTHRTLTAFHYTCSLIERGREGTEEGLRPVLTLTFVLLIMISEPEGICPRLFPVRVTELLILINSETAEALGVGFHSLNQ